MFNTFLQSFKLRNIYKVNTIIYSIKQIPIIKKILPDSLYQNKVLKILGNVISVIIEIASIFLGKLLYIVAMIYGLTTLYQTNSANTFLHIITFLTMIGALLNTYMFNPTKDKYYAMFIMRMDAKQYTITNYMYAILKVIVGFLPFTILFGMMCNINLLLCLIIPFYVASAKVIVGAYSLYKYKKTKITINENKPIKYIWIFTGIVLLITYGLPYINITISPIVFIIIALLSIILGIYSILYIIKFDKYREMYKIILSNEAINPVKSATQATKDVMQKQIEIDRNMVSSKKGYAYLNDIFIKRHSKLLSRAAKKIAIIAVFIIIGLITIVNITDEFKVKINGFIMNSLPYLVLVMYFINRGQNITQAMFINCDHSMLTYSSFRNKAAILKLFKERIKSVVVINLLPAVVIATGLVVLLYVTGGTDNIYNYAILFVSILSMSIFFSIHHLILYYLLQPYNVNSETKSSTYSIANMLTYFACYYMIQFKIPTAYFGILTILFAGVYCVISLILAYKLAPRTFKLRI